MYKELKQLIETMTTSGAPSLDQGSIKRVKQICKYVFGTVNINTIVYTIYHDVIKGHVAMVLMIYLLMTGFFIA